MDPGYCGSPDECMLQLGDQVTAGSGIFSAFFNFSAAYFRLLCLHADF